MAVGLDGIAARDVLPSLVAALRRAAGAGTLEARLADLLAETLPAIGSWCAVDVVTADGALRRIAVLHEDDDRRQAALELQHRFPPHPAERSGPMRVVRTGHPEVVAVQPETAWIVAARDAEQLALLRALGMHPYVVLPLLAGGYPVGALTVVAREHGGFDAGRYALAEAVAACAALLVDQALLRDEADAAHRRRTRDAAADEDRLAAERRQREVAERASRAKSAWLAGMSHEIRTPLTSILGYAELLRLELAPTLAEPQHGRLLRLEASCRHLLDVVGGLLDFARIEAGEAELDTGVHLVAPVVEMALDLVRPDADERGVRLASTVPGDGRCLVGDLARVRQILANLVANAARFSEPGGVVTVSGGSTDAPDDAASLPPGHRWTWIRVRDAGPGISPEQLARLFQPFVRAHPADQDGVGLSLAISRELARRMDGDITVRSELGKGAEFTIWLPEG